MDSLVNIVIWLLLLFWNWVKVIIISGFYCSWTGLFDIGNSQVKDNQGKTVISKLRQFRPMNRIVDDSNSKPNKFERQNLSDYKSDNKFRLRLKGNVDFQLIWNYFWLKPTYFWLKSTYFWFKMSKLAQFLFFFTIKMLIKRLEVTKYNKILFKSLFEINIIFLMYFDSFLIFSIKFERFNQNNFTVLKNVQVWFNII